MFAEVYRQYATHLLAGRLSPPAASDRESTRRILDFVHTHLNPSAGPIRDAAPWNVLVRGAGACDQAAVVGARLLAARGLVARPVVLRAQDGTSPHTALEVLLEGDWSLWDPHFGLEFQAHGRPLTLAQLFDQPELVAQQQFWTPLRAEDQSAIRAFYARIARAGRQPTRWGRVATSMGLRERTIDALTRALAAGEARLGIGVARWLWPRLLAGGAAPAAATVRMSSARAQPAAPRRGRAAATASSSANPRLRSRPTRNSSSAHPIRPMPPALASSVLCC